MASENNENDFGAFVAKERRAIAARRAAFKIDRAAPEVGLALSGGGIRSATFSLGFLQALSARGLLRRVDYLSTVSGGSYIGSFFGALFVPPAGRSGNALPTRPEFSKDRPLQSPLGMEAVRRLRESGRYLTPAGTSDAFFGAAVVMRNWAAVQLVIGLAALFGFWILHIVDHLVTRPLMAWPQSSSPTLGLLAIGTAGCLFASGAAYWMTRRDWIPPSQLGRVFSNGVFWVLVLVVAYFSGPLWAPAQVMGLDFPERTVSLAVAAIGLLTILFFVLAEARHGAIEHKVPDDGTEAAKAQREKDRNNPQLLVGAEDKVRRALSRSIAHWLTALLAVAGLMAIDAIASFVPEALAKLLNPIRSFGDVWRALINSWPLFVSVATPLLSWMAHRQLKRQEAQARARSEGTRIASWLPTLIMVAGIALVAFWLIIWSALTHYFFDEGGISDRGLLALLAVLAAVNFVVSISFSFINLSSLSTFYASRLRRAYIGASSYGTPFVSVQVDDPQDTIGLDAYYSKGPAGGAPAHIINVSIAETVMSSSSLVARDRKGKPLQVTPAGIAYEGDRPGRMIGEHRRFGEELPLANWVAISGAAVAAAIGSGTSLGTSILTTMTNMRLGYWWRRDRSRSEAGLMWSNLRETVQNHLLLELRGAFHGTRRKRWYLTDGGHFENSGAYALLQRSVPFIIVCDNGADPDYAMADVVRLVGRARTDLGVAIDFLSAEELRVKLGDQSPLLDRIGPYPDLARRAAADMPGGPIAALANISYPNGTDGLLLLVKPRLTFTEPPELLAYRAQPGNAHFPQQTTGDQFFDEVQWEAYRRLGELAGEKLFGPRPSGFSGWLPIDPLDEGMAEPAPSDKQPAPATAKSPPPGKPRRSRAGAASKAGE